MDKFLNNMVKYIRENDMVSSGDAVIVAFSGGADSTCLLRALNSVKRLLKVDVIAFHFNHMLRGEESDRDEKFCVDTASSLGIKIYTSKMNITQLAKEASESLEEAGRRARYTSLYDLREQLLGTGAYHNVLIATAHHANDVAETVLMNICRGAGLNGLKGISNHRDSIIRPLLSVSRIDIVQWMHNNSYDYVTDSTNASCDYTRNFLRNVVIPELSERVNKRAVEHIVKVARHANETLDYFDNIADKYVSENIEIVREENMVVATINKSMLMNEHIVIQRYVVAKVIEKLHGSLVNISERHIDDTVNTLSKHSGVRVSLPDGMHVINDKENTYIIR